MSPPGWGRDIITEHKYKYQFSNIGVFNNISTLVSPQRTLFQKWELNVD
jgi:hypothetical protein